MKCPQCENGKMNLTVEVWGEPEKTEHTQITCVHCFGTGEISEKQAQQIQEEKDMWCECGNKNDVVDYYEDGEHPELHKHHYRCRHCQGVVQIG